MGVSERDISLSAEQRAIARPVVENFAGKLGRARASQAIGVVALVPCIVALVVHMAQAGNPFALPLAVALSLLLVHRVHELRRIEDAHDQATSPGMRALFTVRSP